MMFTEHIMNGEKFAAQFFAIINVFICLGGSFGATFVGLFTTALVLITLHG